MIRFIGRENASPNVPSVFISILDQLNMMFNIEKYQTNILKSPSLGEHFYDQLRVFSERYGKQQIVIIFDSLNRISNFQSYLDWIDHSLPKSFKIIYSFSSAKRTIFENVDEANKIDVNGFEFEHAKSILKDKIIKLNYKINYEEWEVVRDCLNNNETIYPIQITLLCDIFTKWPKLIEQSQMTLHNCRTTKDLIKCIFKYLEDKYGRVVFSRIIFYLTIFKNGITENELEDILSIDDIVLASVIGNTRQPILRFPLGLWLRIKYDLKSYLIWNELENSKLYSWKHQIWIDTAQELYLDLFRPSELRDSLLMNIIDYFIEKWNKTPKPYRHSIDGASREISSVRLTKPQIMESEVTINNAKVIYFNRRKLDELYGIIQHINDYKLKLFALKHFVYFDYDFVHAKASRNEMQFFVDVYDEIKSLKYYLKESNEGLYDPLEDLLAISKIYKENFLWLNLYPDSLAHHVLSRINRSYGIVKEFEKKSLVHCGLVVLSNCLPLYDETCRAVFIEKEATLVKEIYWLVESIYLIVKIEKTDKLELHLINHENGKSVGTLNLPLASEHLCIYFNNKRIENDYKSLSEIDGGIIYLLSNRIYLTTFDGADSLVKECTEAISKIFLISKNHLFIESLETVEIVDLQNNALTCFRREFSRTMRVASNLPNNYVYTSSFDHLNSIFTLTSKNEMKPNEWDIEVFQFLKQTENTTFVNKALVEISIESIKFDRFFDLDSIIFRQTSSDNEKDLMRMACSSVRDKRLVLVSVSKSMNIDQSEIRLKDGVFVDDAETNWTIEDFYKGGIVFRNETSVYIYTTGNF